jgi:hypothetical protein
MILARRTLGEALPRAVYGSIALACLGMALLVIG